MQGVAPCKFRHDKQLVSHDTHTAEYNYKYTFSVEIVPICKDDIICLPPRIAQQHGQLGPIVVCTKVRLPLCSPDAVQLLGSPDGCSSVAPHELLAGPGAEAASEHVHITSFRCKV